MLEGSGLGNASSGVFGKVRFFFEELGWVSRDSACGGIDTVEESGKDKGRGGKKEKRWKESERGDRDGERKRAHASLLALI